jgi:hypothetical protein
VWKNCPPVWSSVLVRGQRRGGVRRRWLGVGREYEVRRLT